MAASKKPNLGLTEGWATGDVGWGDPMNDNLTLLDAIVMLGVISATTVTPPVAPAEGDRYIVPAAATGDWSTHIGAVALYQDAAWVYLTPKVGWTARVTGGNRLDWNGTIWADGGSIAEAPEDGGSYARKNGGWVAIGSGGGLPEAPEDGKQYARQDGDWAEVAAAASTLAALTDVDASGKAQAVVLTYDTTAGKWLAKLVALGSLNSYTGYGWDAAHATATATISGAEVTTSATAYEGIHGFAMGAKGYFEVTIEAMGTGGGANNLLGVDDSGTALINTQQFSVAGMWYSPATGLVYGQGNGAQDQIPTAAVGDTIAFAYDNSLKKVWASVRGGSWMSGSVFAGDPAAGTGGFAVVDGTTAIKVPGVFSSDFNGPFKVKINNGQESFKYTPPTGFAGDAVASTVATVSIADVKVTAPTDGQVLTYDAATRKFVNKTPTGGGGSSTLAALTDVAVASMSDHDLFVYKNAASKWVNAQLKLATPATPTLALDATAKSANLTLSNSNTTVIGTGNSAATYGGVFGTTALTYKAYFELTFSGMPLYDMAFGVATKALGTATEAFLTTAANAVVNAYFNNGQYRNGVYVNGVADTNSANSGIPSTNGTLDVAYDPATRKCWIRVNNGDWNGDSSKHNPATGLGGVAVPGTDPVFPYIGVVGTNYTTTYNANALVRTPPTGFVAYAAAETVTPGDVAISTPTDGQVLSYEAASGKWKNKSPASGGGSLSALSDVSVLTPIASQLLAYWGGKWVNTKAQLGPVSTTTLDPATPATVSLSNGNMTVTHNQATWDWVRTTTLRTSGKFYAECTIAAIVTGVGLGLANAAHPTAAGTTLGTGTNGVQFYNAPTVPSSGLFYNGAPVSGSTPTSPPVQGDTIGMAVDLTAKKVWFWNPKTSMWNNDVIANQNPATGTGGFDLTTMMASGGLYIGVAMQGTGASGVLNLGATAFVNTAPAGFGAWDTAGSPLADVVVSSPARAQSLGYDDGLKVWRNVPLQLAASGAIDPGFDAANSSAGWTLSNSNKTAANPATLQKAMIAKAALVGKQYFEITIDSGTLSSNQGVGIGQTANQAGQIGWNIPNSMGLQIGSPKVYNVGASGTGAQVGTAFSALSIGDTICVAYDATARKGWIRVNGGLWNNTAATSQDPASALGGGVLSGTGAVYPAISTDAIAQFTLKMSAGEFKYAIPTGFSAPASLTALAPSDVNVSNPQDGQLLKYDAASGKWINATIIAGTPYDIPMFFPGKPANSQRMARIRIARAFTMSKTAAHLADADAAATAAVSMPLKNNGASIGAITFAAGSATGVVALTVDVTFAAGDTLTWDNQAATDATLGNISATLLGTRS